MLNFWTLSAIAAFHLGVNGEFGGGPSSWGQSIRNIPNRPKIGGDDSGPSPNRDIPMPQIKLGDDEIRIASITLFCRLTFFFWSFHCSV